MKKMLLQQLELFEWENLTQEERRRIIMQMAGAYWFIRNMRSSYQHAEIRKQYRKVAEFKKRLRLGGVSHDEILLLLRHLRGQCSVKKHPFEPCKYCIYFAS